LDYDQPVEIFSNNNHSANRVSKNRLLSRSFFSKGRKYFFGNIAPGINCKRRFWIRDFVIGVFGIKHTKTIMMFGGKHHVFHPSFFCCCRPFFRVKIYRVKSGLQIFIRFYIIKIIIRLAFFSATGCPAKIFRANAPSFENIPLAI